MTIKTDNTCNQACHIKTVLFFSSTFPQEKKSPHNDSQSFTMLLFPLALKSKTITKTYGSDLLTVKSDGLMET